MTRALDRVVRSRVAIAGVGGRCAAARSRAQARAGVGRRPQRLPARLHLSRRRDDRAARPRIGRLRHVHPHRLAADHQASDHVSRRHRHRHRRAVQRPQPELLRRDLLLRRPRDRSLGASSAPTCCRSCKDDGKGFVAAHSAATAFFSWPEFGEMLGGRFDEHPVGHRRRHRRRRRSGVSGDAAPAARVGVSRRALSDQGFLARQDPRARASRRRRSWI